MKKYFFSGLAIILPIILTFLVLNFLVKFLTAPFLALTQYVLTQIAHAFGSNYFDHSQLSLFISQLLILLFLFSLIMLVGALGRHFLTNALISLGDRLIHSIPFANKIYKAVQDVVKNIFNEDKPSFSKAVIVPFPHSKAEAIGFITKENMASSITSSKHEDYISVFVPGTPNPMMGFMLLVPKKFLKPLNLTMDEALKFVVSCGVIYKKNKK